jgi:hypothetical protein
MKQAIIFTTFSILIPGLIGYTIGTILELLHLPLFAFLIMAIPTIVLSMISGTIGGELSDRIKK